MSGLVVFLIVSAVFLVAVLYIFLGSSLSRGSESGRTGDGGGTAGPTWGDDGRGGGWGDGGGGGGGDAGGGGGGS